MSEAIPTNEQIAEWCEPKPTGPGREDWDQSPLRVGSWNKFVQRWIAVYNFAESRDECSQFERLVREREVWRWYVHALASELGGWEELREEQHEDLVYMDFADATPEQRCRALGRVMEAYPARREEVPK